MYLMQYLFLMLQRDYSYVMALLCGDYLIVIRRLSKGYEMLFLKRSKVILSKEYDLFKSTLLFIFPFVFLVLRPVL
jgi:hypothetical protein